MPALKNAKHELFAQAVVRGKTDVESYVLAGYSKDTAERNAWRLKENEGIRSRIVELLEASGKRAELSAARVLEEYRRLAFVDLTQFFDESGNLKPLSQLTPEQGACLASFEVIKKNAEAGDGKIDVVHKFRVWDKTKALESLAKHFGLLIERIEHQGELSIKWQEQPQ